MSKMMWFWIVSVSILICLTSFGDASGVSGIISGDQAKSKFQQIENQLSESPDAKDLVCGADEDQSVNRGYCAAIIPAIGLTTYEPEKLYYGCMGYAVDGSKSKWLTIGCPIVQGQGRGMKYVAFGYQRTDKTYSFFVFNGKKNGGGNPNEVKELEVTHYIESVPIIKKAAPVSLFKPWTWPNLFS